MQTGVICLHMDINTLKFERYDARYCLHCMGLHPKLCSLQFTFVPGTIVHAQPALKFRKLAINSCIVLGKGSESLSRAKESVLSAAAKMLPSAMWQRFVQGFQVMQENCKNSVFVQQPLLSQQIVTGVTSDTKTCRWSVMQLAHT